MPVYAFKCECGCRDEVVRPSSSRNDPIDCHTCGKPMSRDIHAEHGTVQTEWAEPLYSEAAGIHPDQIAEARARFPHHEYASDGRMIFRSPQHQRRCLKDIGFIDRDAFR